MKWLKLDCDFRNDPKILCLIQQFGGKEACSFWTLLLSYVGANGMPKCEIHVSENGPHSLSLIASFLCTKPKVALTMLSACAHLSLIQPERWTNDSVISIPNMLKRVDDYTRKVRTKSGQSPEKPAVEQKKNRTEEEEKIPVPIHSSNTETSVIPHHVRTARKTRAPTEFAITDPMRLWAKDNGITVDLDAETAAMLDHHRGKGNLHDDWEATWRTWMRNTKKFSNRNNGKPNGQPKEHYQDRVARENRETQARIDQQLFAADGDRDGTEDPSGTHLALLPRPK